MRKNYTANPPLKSQIWLPRSSRGRKTCAAIGGAGFGFEPTNFGAALPLAGLAVSRAVGGYVQAFGTRCTDRFHNQRPCQAPVRLLVQRWPPVFSADARARPRSSRGPGQSSNAGPRHQFHSRQRSERIARERAFRASPQSAALRCPATLTRLNL